MTCCWWWMAQVDSGRDRGDSQRACTGQALPEPPAPDRHCHSRFWTWGWGQKRQQPSSLSRAWSCANKGACHQCHQKQGARDAERGSDRSGQRPPQQGEPALHGLTAAPHSRPHRARRDAWAPGLTTGQLSGGHACFVVTTTSPSWCFSHSCVTQRFPGSDQDSPGCKEAPVVGECSPRATSLPRASTASVCLSPACGFLRVPRPLPGACLAVTAPRGPRWARILPTQPPAVPTGGAPSGPEPHLPGAPRGGFAPKPAWTLGPTPPRTCPEAPRPHWPCGQNSRRRGGRSCRWCS